MKQMTRRERITAAINREPVDRVPYAVWRHFPAVDHSPAVLATVFSPLSIARKLSGDRLAADLRERPDAVAGAVDAIGETVLRFNELALREGIGGIFYSIQAASGSILDEETYARFGEPWDR